MVNRGKRYEDRKLNMKKVSAVIIAVIVIVMCIVTLNLLLSNTEINNIKLSKGYYASYKDEKWGVIDSSGKDIIVPSYMEMIVVPNHQKDVFVITYDANYETGEYKTKVVNSENKELFTEYDKVEAIANIYGTNQLVYETNLLKVQKDGKYGVINLDGTVVVETKYDSIEALQGTKEIFKVTLAGNYGIVNNIGTEIIVPAYVDIEIFDEENKSYLVKNGENKYGVIDINGDIILPVKYEKIEKDDSISHFIVTEAGIEKLVTPDQITILETGYDSLEEVVSSNTKVIYEVSDKYGIMDISGNIIIEPKYEYLEEINTDIFMVKENGKSGVIDISGNVKLESKYNYVAYNEKANAYISEDDSFNNEIYDSGFNLKYFGYLIETNEEKSYFKINENGQYKYYGFDFTEKNVAEIEPGKTLFVSKKDDKYGFIDKDGNVIVEYIYDDALEQNEYGFAAIKKDGKWGSIDENGDIVQEPKYDLEEYYIVDFIGRWHYGKDINMNYYNQL